MPGEERIGKPLERVLRGFEQVQEHLLFHQAGAAQTDLHVAVGEPLDELVRWLDEAGDDPLCRDLREPIDSLVEAKEAFLRRDRDFSLSFFAMRRSFSRALPLLYAMRERIPSLRPYWFEEQALPRADTLEAISADPETVGLRAWERTDERAEYAMYVPETYTPDRSWPLIVCLHGGYGREDEYLWSWMRTAKSHAQIVLSAKSKSSTWSFAIPDQDFASVLAMLDEVEERFAVERDRILLTGLSDGGTFTYLLGLRHANRFSALAPIAAAGFHPMLDVLLREGAGKELPIHLVHGVHDPIFPVATARATHQLLEAIHYRATYTELPDWGHAIPYSIHERIIFPWFAGLGE